MSWIEDTKLNVSSPQAARSAAEDLRVDVPISASVGPAGERHYHVLYEHGQGPLNQNRLQAVCRGQVPQETWRQCIKTMIYGPIVTCVHISHSERSHGRLSSCSVRSTNLISYLREQ